MAYLKTNYNQKIAFKANKGKSPTIIFIHGLNSDMEGLKSINLHKFTKKNNLKYVRFDCRGHGKSFGKFEEFTITDWKNDLNKWQVEITINNNTHVDPNRYEDDDVLNKVVEYYKYYYNKHKLNTNAKG